MSPATGTTPDRPRVSMLPGLLMPMQGFSLVLPNEAVAEIIGYEPPAPAEGAPPWYLGSIGWRGLDLPVMSYEVLNAKPVKRHAPRARIAVMNGVGGDERLPFFGIVTQGIPSLVRLHADELSRVEKKKGPADTMIVNTKDGEAAIPNVLLMEKMLLRFLHPE